MCSSDLQALGDRAIGSRWQVTQGLQAGDRVIVDGLQRIKPGDAVKAVPVSMDRASALTPAPAASLPGASASPPIRR